MGKQHILLALLIASVFFIVGCTAATQYICPDGRVVADKTGCAAEKLSVDSQMSVCTGMPSTQSYSIEDMCVMGVAAKNNDTSLCKKLSRDQRPACLALVAEAKNDPTICAGSESDYQCYELYARDKKDGSVCGNIKETSPKDNCYSNMANQLRDVTLCDKISGVDQRDSCYVNMMYSMRDSSICDKITGSSQKQQCLQIVQGNQQQGIVMKY
ncbi:hypothetical protein HYU07_00900 [Candidatus Woesearchaeota archaeon]|nr:hypothetical protein [Candidatus Woesearchaeota archaeon]